ncbi:Far upstream element-binding protein 3 [Ceratocystis fimbriata CBS 114723]|uniref:Far upstream element-binding protein 3 n=1 Tax=Ceratocystis fimbriata CBS 114723 TaxID=1035309 RepID=A0A2C5XDF3_9PEZI|nr:Far upstream element-binding protein 3 [Ceratocystis fimbriata CBS 114723]
MSAPQDIQSILAALAAQQVPIAGSAPPHTSAIATPLPGISQQPPHSAAPLYTAIPGYGLPTSAPNVHSPGGYDRGATQSADSSKVSIAEATAQAKAFAAQKGLSFDRDSSNGYRSAPIESRGEPRPSYGGRSRSRSPAARRETYRENYNPYRDERREERSYGRDNTYGQDSRGRTDAHRSPIIRGPPGADDGSTFEIFEVNANLVGLVIGRSGENLRRIENESGCRVQFLGTSESGQRECKITGPKPRREEVKAAIDATIVDSGALGMPRPKPRGTGPVSQGPPGAPREGEDHMQIMVPDRTVGLIIGRKGETISDLQERSGCHINIVDETKSVDGLRPVNLIGTPEETQRAKDMIMQIVDSDSRDSAASGGGPTGGHGGPMKPFNRDPYAGPRDPAGYGGPRNNANNGDTYGIPVPTGPDVITDEMQVPSEAVGMIIGKKGETIREIQATSGCKINVTQGAPNGDDSQRSIGLIGTPDAIRQAKGAISDRIDAMRQRQATSGPYGGPRRDDRNDYDNRGRAPRDNGGYGTRHTGAPQSNPSHGAPRPSDNGPPAAGDPDPYAQYGGYQNYLTLWYQQWMTQASQGQAPAAGQPPVSNPP